MDKNFNHLYIKARAKINLALDITGKRDDGYHEISTIMQSIELCDGIYLKKVYKPNYLKLVSTAKWLPTNERNLAYQAANYLKKRFNIDEGVFINIEKNIPSSAGLGGGSADCAATLVGMRNLFNLPLTNKDLAELSVQFGADVPFCIIKGCAHAKGIGEILRPIHSLPNMYIVLIKPGIFVSTAEIFKELNLTKLGKRPDIERMIYALKHKDIKGIALSMGNVLESVTTRKHPIIAEIKDFLMNKGAFAAMMTGSGSTVFGLFVSPQNAYKAANAAKKAYPDFREIFITKPRPNPWPPRPY